MSRSTDQVVAPRRRFLIGATGVVGAIGPARWNRMPDQTPDGESICRRIESFDEDGNSDPLNGEREQ